MCPDLSIQTRLPHHLEERTLRFKAILHDLIQEKGIHPSKIACLDELFLHFAPGTAAPASKEQQKSCTVGGMLKHPGSHGADATVVLSATADGQLLPPLVLLKVNKALAQEDTKEINSRVIVFKHKLAV